MAKSSASRASEILGFLESRSRAAAIVRLTCTLCFILVLWQIVAVTLVTNRLLLVPPGDVFVAWLHEIKTGALLKNAEWTIWAILISFPFAVAVGVGIGLALASSRLLSLTMGPVLSALNSMPVVALAPLFIAWLGLGLASKFAIVILVAIFPIVVTTESGLKAADKPLIDAAKSFNASTWRIFTTVTLPFAIPFIVSGVRVAWARALTGVIVAEFFGSFAGFGYAILAAGQTFDTATLLCYVFMMALLGLLGSMAFEWLERRLAPWRHE